MTLRRLLFQATAATQATRATTPTAIRSQIHHGVDAAAVASGDSHSVAPSPVVSAQPRQGISSDASGLYNPSLHCTQPAAASSQP